MNIDYNGIAAIIVALTSLVAAITALWVAIRQNTQGQVQAQHGAALATIRAAVVPPAPQTPPVSNAGFADSQTSAIPAGQPAAPGTPPAAG